MRNVKVKEEGARVNPFQIALQCFELFNKWPLEFGAYGEVNDETYLFYGKIVHKEQLEIQIEQICL